MFTRIDLEQNGRYGVIVKSWEKGWQEGDPPAKTEYLENTTVFQVLSQIDKDGSYTVEMCDENTGRALCGEITRIDFSQEGEKWTVKKFPYGWTAKTRPLSIESKPADFDLEAAFAWLQEHGWTTRRYPGGARAWKGQILPVRDDNAIRRMRGQTNRAFWAGQIGDGEAGSRRNYDFAFDF